MKARSFSTVLVALLLVVSVPAVLLAEDAAALFGSRCTPCHGKDGSGNTPMGKKVGAKSLASPEVQKLSDADMAKVIASGKGKMPPFATKLSSEQIGEVVKLIRSFATK